MTQQTAKTIIVGELRKRISVILLMVFFLILTILLSVALPLLFKRLVDVTIPGRDMSEAGLLLVALITIPLISAALNALYDYRREIIGEAIAQALRQKLFKHLIHANLRDLEATETGHIIHHITRGCGLVGDDYIVDRLIPLISNALLFAGALAAMALINWRLMLITLLAFPITYLFSQRLKNYVRMLEEEFLRILESGSSTLQQVFSGIRTVRSFSGEVHEKARWDAWIRRHWEVRAKTETLHNLILILPTHVVDRVLMGVVFGVGAFEIINGRLSIGDLIAFMMYTPYVYTALRAMLQAQVTLEKIKVAIEGLDGLFAYERERQGGRELAIAPEAGPSIQFEDVSFDYGRGDFALRDVSFSVRPGEFFGIVGVSGGGKTTILDLLMGFYAPQTGRILVNDIDIQELSLASLRGQIGLAPQDIFLWNSSIYENLAYPDAIAAETVAEAAAGTNLQPFIEALPEKYQTVVGERGLALSGGERQRVAICRAILKQPAILLLDEATSELDALTEAKVQEAIDHAKRGRTTIAVAHRLATVIHADRILVLDDGRVVEVGTPEDLIARRGLFYRLYEAQKLERAV
ncbi:MAG: ABC transporter ATP-binding protein [Chloroflexi bacterium]|nr:ABC transporter ATP-binding protein [Chloroflexota bacterium]